MNVWPRDSGGVKRNFLASTNPSTHSCCIVLSVTRHRRTWKQPRISPVIGSRNGKTVGRLDYYLSTCYWGSSSPAILFGNVRYVLPLVVYESASNLYLHTSLFDLYSPIWLLVRSFVPICPPINRYFVESKNSLSHIRRETRVVLFSFSDLYARSVFRGTSSFILPTDVYP